MSAALPALIGALVAAAVLLGRRPRTRAGAALRRPGPGRARAGAVHTLAARLPPGLLTRARPVDGGEVGALVGEVAALLRAGALPADAWDQAAARRPLVAAAMARGRDPSVARATAGARAAAQLAQELGAPPADVLDRTVGALVEAAAAQTAREAALAGPRASARLLGALPLAGFALGVALGADPASVLLDGGPGTVCLVVGVVLYAVGARWVAREVARAQRDDDGGTR